MRRRALMFTGKIVAIAPVSFKKIRALRIVFRLIDSSRMRFWS